MTGALMSLLGSAAPAGASGAFESIATVTTTSGQTTATFSSIPQTYASLHIRVFIPTVSSGSGADIEMYVNGVTGSGSYPQHFLRGSGSAVSVSGRLNDAAWWVGNAMFDTAAPCVAIIDLHDYSNSTRNKTVRSFSGKDANGSGRLSLMSGMTTATTAVTSITIRPTVSYEFPTGSVIALYGVKGA